MQTHTDPHLSLAKRRGHTTEHTRDALAIGVPLEGRRAQAAHVGGLYLRSFRSTTLNDSSTAAVSFRSDEGEQWEAQARCLWFASVSECAHYHCEKVLIARVLWFDETEVKEMPGSRRYTMNIDSEENRGPQFVFLKSIAPILVAMLPTDVTHGDLNTAEGRATAARMRLNGPFEMMPVRRKMWWLADGCV